MKLPLDITPELAEEVGWHIGDGSMNFYKNRGKLKGFYQLRGHIDDDRDHYLTRIKPLFKSIYEINISLREMPSTRVFGFQIWNDELVRFKQKLGLTMGKKFDISIPKIFLDNDNLKKSVIRGIFDTDGGIYLAKKNNKLYPSVYITTICPTLASQLMYLFNELGLRATKFSLSLNKDFKRQQTFRIITRGEEMFHKFIQDIKPQNRKHLLKYQKFVNSKKL